MGSVSAQARSIEGVDFPDSVTVDGSTKLVLNGVALRSKNFIVTKVKVYVAGLYAATLSKDPAVLLASERPRRLRLVFLRAIGRKTLVGAWTEGFEKNCLDDCTRAKASLDAFNATMADVEKGDDLIVDFSKEGVTVFVKKPSAGVSIKDPYFARDLLNVFIGAHPATEELKKGLLGL
jgi:hypothetical protein